MRLDEVVKALSLNASHLAFLRENAMVGTAEPPRHYERFADAYEWLAEDAGLPVLVTSDSMLDAYHLIFDELLAQVEGRMLIGDAINLSRSMMLAFDRLAPLLAPEQQHLAKENVVFFGAALRMLLPDAEVPGCAEADVSRILGLALNASGFWAPPGFERPEDFSQYKPRGHYTRSDELSRYFRAMMWYGRITFHDSSIDETRRAVMIALEMTADPVASAALLRISSVIDYMVGTADDLTHVEYADAARQVFGEMGRDYAPLFSEARLDEFKEMVLGMRRPRILSELVTDQEAQEAGDWNEVALGMRVFGQRFVPDSYIFQKCVYNEVQGPPWRLMPTALDVMSALGSEEAWSREDFASNHPSFKENLAALKEEFADLPEEQWNRTIYMTWLDSLRTIDDDTSTDGFPLFMRTAAWRAKQLNTQAGSWTQLTHDTILYRKQSYTTELLCTSPPPKCSNYTYVEPVPELFGHLAAMATKTRSLLDGLGLDLALVDSILTGLIDAMGSLERVARCELNGTAPDPADVRSARNAYKLTTLEIDGEKLQTKTVLVSDVHTDPNDPASCLEEAVGYIKFVVVVVQTEEGLLACVGPVFEHYEFVQPLSEGRLTDTEWLGMLMHGEAPEAAPWARSFLL